MHDINLPSGATATMKDSDDLTYGDREDFLASMRIDLDGKAQGVTGGRIMADMERGLISAAVVAWTVTHPTTNATLPIPSVSPKSLRDLKNKDIQALYGDARKLKDDLFPEDFGPDSAVKQDPETGELTTNTESPTTPSVA